MEKPYHTIHKNDTQALVHFLTTNGQALLPMVELIVRLRTRRVCRSRDGRMVLRWAAAAFLIYREKFSEDSRLP